MFRWLRCRFAIELDDIALAWDSGNVLCVACAARQKGEEVRMRKALIKELEAVLAGVA